MSYRSQGSQRRGASRQFAKSTREKTKEKKKRQEAKYLQEETPSALPQEVAEKTVNRLNNLGNQIFALSPFSQYFDDWLINLRQTVSEFESNPSIKADEQFVKERSQIILDVEGVLAEMRLQEANLSQEAKALADNNHLIVEADKQYAEKTRDLSTRRNVEVQRLSKKVRELEDSVAAQLEIKFGFFKFREKREAAEKLDRTNKELTAAKNELEVTLQNFTAEQDKLHDNYEKRKQELSETSDRLHRELEKLESDTSAEARQTATNAIAQSVQELLKRMPQPSSV
jgi:DNA repair exonuclease SbcCD ATPase subunit